MASHGNMNSVLAAVSSLDPNCQTNSMQNSGLQLIKWEWVLWWSKGLVKQNQTTMKQPITCIGEMEAVTIWKVEET